jgi:hypothetical protein
MTRDRWIDLLLATGSLRSLIGPFPGDVEHRFKAPAA